MEGDVDEPREMQYLVVRRVRCTAQQERQFEELFNGYPVAVDEIIYQRGEWNDPILQSKKEQLPPWIQHPVAGSGWGRSRGAAQSPSKGFVIDHRKKLGRTGENERKQGDQFRVPHRGGKEG